MITESENPRHEGEGTPTVMENGCLFDGKGSKTSENEQVLPDYFGVGREYFCRGEELRHFADIVEVTRKVDRQYCIDRLGKEGFANIPRFEAFVSMPSHTNYQRVVDGRFINLYHPLPFRPAEKEMPTPCTDKLMRRIFGDQLDMGWMYLAWLYQRPTQPLPVLCIGSVENHSGKTSFFEFENQLFGDNHSILSSGDLMRDFMPYGTNLISSFEEVSSGKKAMDKIKLLATARRLTINRKYQSEVEIDSCLHLQISTNRPDSFLKVTDQDIRFWIRIVPPMTPEEYDPNFREKLRAEIPAVMRKLAHMELCEKRSRMVFDPADLKCDALDRLVANSKSACAKNIEEWIGQKLEQCPEGFDASASDIWNDADFPSNKFTPAEIVVSLKTELHYEVSKRRYRNLSGVSVSGRAYHFGTPATNVTENEALEEENLPF